MYKRLVTVALAVMSVPALGFAAFGAAQAVSASPAPQVIIPASVQSSHGGADDPANHEANHVAGADDPANHEANHAVAHVPGADDPVNHEVRNGSGPGGATAPSAASGRNDRGSSRSDR